jgi:hypothetical protein
MATLGMLPRASRLNVAIEIGSLQDEPDVARNPYIPHVLDGQIFTSACSGV